MVIVDLAFVDYIAVVIVVDSLIDWFKSQVRFTKVIFIDLRLKMTKRNKR